MGLLVDAEHNHVGERIRMQTLGGIELSDGSFRSTLLGQSTGQAAVRHIVPLGDAQRMSPQSLAVVPISRADGG